MDIVLQPVPESPERLGSSPFVFRTYAWLYDLLVPEAVEETEIKEEVNPQGLLPPGMEAYAVQIGSLRLVAHRYVNPKLTEEVAEVAGIRRGGSEDKDGFESSEVPFA